MADSTGFLHTDVGTPEASWAVDERWATLPRLALAGRHGKPASRVVVVAAHPDDETLGAAGLLALAHDTGLTCVVIVATDGERSHPGSASFDPAQLGARRRHELARAIAVCAPSADLVHLGLPDGELAERVQVLAGVLATHVDSDTIVCAPWRSDGHPDHEAAGRAAAQVAASAGARLLEYPIWLWHWGTPDDLPWPMAFCLGLPEEAGERKTIALTLHESQVTPWSDQPGEEAILHPAMLEHFSRGWETFLDCGAVADPRSETFDAMFDDVEDPWRVTSAWYEERKRAVCLAALPTRELGAVLEVGCSIGVLTERLADRSASVLGLDLSARALAAASRRLAGRSHVRLRQAGVPRDWPHGEFDTIVLSEVCYFLDPVELDEVLDLAVTSLSGSGSILVCDWRHPIVGWPLQGDQIHEIVRATTGLEVVSHFEDADFAVDVLRRPGLGSVAAREGLV